MVDVTEDELQALYTWVDECPLSRPKRNIARDFADGVLVAEIVASYHPKLVELHNYSAANALSQKLYNWSTLNQKVFRKLGFVIAKSECEAVANCEPGAVERVLKLLKIKLAGYVPAPGSQDGTSTSAPGAQDGSFFGNTQQGSNQPAASTQAAGYGATASVTLRGNGGAGLDKGTAAALAEKDQTILELRETNEIMETKVRKLEQLVRLKDAKIQTLLAKMQAAGIN